MKYLLIDGNNLAARSAFANEQLENQDGVPSGVHFGVFQSLIRLKKDFPDSQFLVVWDGKSARRVKEASKAVEEGIIPSGYKENRARGEDIPIPLKNFYEQADYLKRAIGATGIPQIRMKEYEADDIIATYCKILGEHNDVVAVTSDKDYWQLLDENVSLWDGMKAEMTTKSSWEKEYGLEPIKAIDIGALMGDTSDNIHGIPGWGMKTAIKELKKYGDIEGIYKAYHKEYDKLREEYPDFKDGDEGLDAISMAIEAKTEKGRRIYPEVTIDSPWAGVVVAFHGGKVKMPKATLMALVFEERVKLAYSLKRMDIDIPNLPIVENESFDKEKLEEYFEYYDIHTLQDEIYVFDK